MWKHSPSSSEKICARWPSDLNALSQDICEKSWLGQTGGGGTTEVGVHLRAAWSSGNSVLANKNFGHAKTGPYAPQDIKRGDRFLASVIFTLPLKLSHLTLGPSCVSLVMGKASQLGISIGLFGVGSFKNHFHRVIAWGQLFSEMLEKRKYGALYGLFIHLHLPWCTFLESRVMTFQGFEACSKLVFSDCLRTRRGSHWK